MGKPKKILLKELCPWTVSENTFEAGPSGGSGALNYQTPYGTPQGGNYTQNSDHFGGRDINKGPNHMDSDKTGSVFNQPLPDRNDRQSSSGAPIHPGAMSDKAGFENPDAGEKPNHMVSYDSKDNEKNPEGSEKERPNAPGSELSEPSPGAQYDKINSEKPLNPDQTYDKDVDKIFKKKQTPSPDEIMSALQYELGKMVKKDKTIAKRIMLKNLKEDPHYYSKLDMLNIDDDKMKVDESTVAKTKNVLDQMIAERKARQTPTPPYLNDIFNGLHKRRHGFSTNPEQSKS